MNLNKIACEIVGDGKRPNLFFVSYEGNVVTITKSFGLAYKQWERIASQTTPKECTLEDRLFGCIASVEPDEDVDGRLITIDDSEMFKDMYMREEI